MNSRRGIAPGGRSIEPSDLPDEEVDPTAAPRAMPSPGLPVSEEEYARMKEAAEHTPARSVEHAQEDRPRKKD